MKIIWTKTPKPFEVPKGMRRVIFVFWWILAIEAVFFVAAVYRGDWYAMIDWAVGSGLALMIWHHHHVWVPNLKRMDDEFFKDLQEVRKKAEGILHKNCSKN